ncbi:MAG: extracellular solute-binding protein [Actinomycetota bacterium]|nr:extracellular solute-binding protein [Actinomycetota bacterium]
MNVRNTAVSNPFQISRRDVVRSGIGAGAVVASMAGRRSVRAQDGESLVFLSTQLAPVEESEKVRNVILADFEGEVEFITEDIGPFNDRIAAETQSGTGSVGVIGGQHGDFASFAADGLLMDLSDLATELQDRGFPEQYLELGRYGGETLNYIPWMQATYVMVANRDALQYLPEGLDEAGLQTSLTYDQLAAWVASISAAEGQKFGLPAGEMGLYHRFLQGYAYPSFTGGVNSTFASDAAVTMWQWLKDAWQYVNPQAVNYDNLSDPLLTGEIWVGWDHTARLITALRENPDALIAFPAPRGPKGLGFMPVVAGLAIPKTSPDPAAARALIEYLTRPEVQATTLREVAFFPVVGGDLPTDLGEGVQKEVDAVQATTGSDAALESLLPVGLGEQGGAYNDVFKATFRAIVLDGNDIATVLAEQAVTLQSVLETAGAACWAPDPASEGVCQVG